MSSARRSKYIIWRKNRTLTHVLGWRLGWGTEVVVWVRRVQRDDVARGLAHHTLCWNCFLNFGVYRIILKEENINVFVQKQITLLSLSLYINTPEKKQSTTT